MNKSNSQPVLRHEVSAEPPFDHNIHWTDLDLATVSSHTGGNPAINTTDRTMANRIGTSNLSSSRAQSATQFFSALTHGSSVPSLSAYHSNNNTFTTTANASNTAGTQSSIDLEIRCWEHGCDGRRFSSLGNYRRHTREKNQCAKTFPCLTCGKLFTRSTARNLHQESRVCDKYLTGMMPVADMEGMDCFLPPELVQPALMNPAMFVQSRGMSLRWCPGSKAERIGWLCAVSKIWRRWKAMCISQQARKIFTTTNFGKFDREPWNHSVLV